MKKYLHLIKGKPAVFESDQICFAGRILRLSKMANSLDQIKEEQKLSRQFRKKKGFDKTPPFFEYSHILIKD